MTQIPLLLSDAHTQPSPPNGVILSFERKSIQKLLKTCGQQLRTTSEPILLDLIAYNRISLEVRRHLNSLSQSHWISLTGHGTLLAVIPLSTLVDSICSARRMTGLSFEMKKLLNVCNLIGERNWACGLNSWAIVGPSSITEYLATLSWFEGSSSTSLLSDRWKQLS